ncbi:hypothetical protein KIPB_011822, partial [Kipferlia bialata]|eukprot:g11822.t1
MPPGLGYDAEVETEDHLWQAEEAEARAGDLSLSQIPLVETKRRSLRAKYDILGKALGEGSYGKVFKVQEKEGEKRVFAAKFIDFAKYRTVLNKYLPRELSALNRTQSPYVVGYVDHFFDLDSHGRHMVIIMEFLEGNDLLRYSTSSEEFRTTLKNKPSSIPELVKNKYPHLLPGRHLPYLLVLIEQ